MFVLRILFVMLILHVFDYLFICFCFSFFCFLFFVYCFVSFCSFCFGFFFAFKRKLKKYNINFKDKSWLNQGLWFWFKTISYIAFKETSRCFIKHGTNILKVYVFTKVRAWHTLLVGFMYFINKIRPKVYRLKTLISST